MPDVSIGHKVWKELVKVSSQEQQLWTRARKHIIYSRRKLGPNLKLKDASASKLDNATEILLAVAVIDCANIQYW